MLRGDITTLLGKTGSYTSSSGTNAYDWFPAKTDGALTLLQSPDPSGGTAFKIVKNHTTALEEQIFPTTQMPANDGNSTVERNIENAYAKFNDLISSSVGTAKLDVRANLAQSFEDMDSKLLALSKFDKDLVLEIQRTGRNGYGGPKKTLNLDYPSGFLFPKDKENRLRLARLAYASYPVARRLEVLRDLKDSTLMNFLDGQVISELRATNRELRIKYEDSLTDESLNEFASGAQSLLPDEAYASFSVEFVDQNGQVIPDLPYIASIRGIVNFRESYLKTEGGNQPGMFASGITLFEPSDKATNGFHSLYRYKINEEIPLRGSFKAMIYIPEFETGSHWDNSRLKIYSGTPKGESDREASLIPPKAGTPILTQTFAVNGKKYDYKIRVPVYREPIPMHLVMNASGQLVSKWSTIENITDLPSHQKVRLKFKTSRLKQSELWEKADKNADYVIDQDEYSSPEGEAARNDINLEERTPMRGVDIELRPDASNTWASARTNISATTDLSGTATMTASIGRYEVFLISQDQSGQHSERKLATIEVPAGGYFRDTSSIDTTPIGAAGASMVERADTTLGNFHLKQQIPRLLDQKKPTFGTIYGIPELKGIEFGWPGAAGTETSDVAFDEFEAIMPPLPGEIHLEETYEDIEQPEETGPQMPDFYQTLELTQEGNQAVVKGTTTPSGTKWQITRVILDPTVTPQVMFANTYEPSESPNQQNKAVADVNFTRRPSMQGGIEVFAFYPKTGDTIEVSPVKNTKIQNSGTGLEYTHAIIDTHATEESSAVTYDHLTTQAIIDAWSAGTLSYGQAANLLQTNHGWSSTDVADSLVQTSDALPIPSNTPTIPSSVLTAKLNRFENNDLPDSFAVSTPAPSSDGLPSSITQNAVTQNMMSTTAIINAYSNGATTYSEAYSALESDHGWSYLDITETLDPLYNNHQAAVASAQQAANNASLFAMRAAQQAEAQEQAQAQAAQASAIAAMNTDGDGYITWRNGLTLNEIASREAAMAAAVAEAAAYAASPEGQAAQAAESARIAAEIASAAAEGRVPRL